jgi:hypothetical protein
MKEKEDCTSLAL